MNMNNQPNLKLSMNEMNMNNQPNLKLSINRLKVTIHHKFKMKRDKTRIQNRTSKFNCISFKESIHEFS